MKRTVIYEPRGKAREYAPLALNLYRGCFHGCLYCFAPTATFADREVFHDPTFIKPRPGILEDLEEQAGLMAGDKREILLSFTSDPYQPIEKEARITRVALEILMAHNLTATILTKGGTWGLKRDSDLLTLNPANAWSVTLTHDTNETSRQWEPDAALPEDRIDSLSMAKKLGLKTWVSFEPVIDPEAVYRLLEATHEFVDLYKVGKLNYHPLAKEIDWRRFKGEMEERLTRLGKPYYLKKDLLEAAA
ncbi:MAG: SPL family radical SAM protein [Thermodesulfobacteriota bacterium]